MNAITKRTRQHSRESKPEIPEIPAATMVTEIKILLEENVVIQSKLAGMKRGEKIRIMREAVLLMLPKPAKKMRINPWRDLDATPEAMGTEVQVQISRKGVKSDRLAFFICNAKRATMGFATVLVDGAAVKARVYKF